MFLQKKSHPLDRELQRAYAYLNSHQFGSEEYARTMMTINELNRMKAGDQPNRVSPDTALVVGANLLSILMMIKHEYLGNLITSRAMNVLLKPKL